MAVIGEVYAKVGAKDGGLARDVENIAHEGGKRGGERISSALNGVRPGFYGIRREAGLAFGEVAKNAATAFGVAFAAEKGAEFLKESVKDAMSYNDAVLRLQNSMRNNPALVHASSSAFEELATRMSETTKTSATTALSGEAMLASFKLNQGQIEQLLPLVNDYSTKFGVDLPNAARLFGRAATGSTGALGRLGVSIDKAKAKADPFGATLDALRTKAGGFAEEQGATLQGRLAILRNSFEDLRVKVGNAVLPVLITLANFAVTRLLPIFEKVAEVIGEAAHWIAEQWKILVEGFKDPSGENKLTGFARTVFGVGQTIARVFADIKRAWADVVAGFKGGQGVGSGFDAQFIRLGNVIHHVVDVFRELYTKAKPYLGDLARALAAVLAIKAVLAFGGAITSVISKIRAMVTAMLALFELNPVVLLITAIAIALFELYKHSETFRNGVNALVAGIRRDFMPAMQAIWSFIQTNILPILRQLWTSVQAMFDSIVASARRDWPAVQQIITTVFAVIKGIITAFVVIGLALWHTFGSTIVRIVTIYFRTVFGVIQGALNIVLGVIGLILNLITGRWGKAWDSVKQIVSGVWKIITSIVSGELGTLGAILGRLLSLVVAPFRGAFNAALGVVKSIGAGIVALVRGYISLIVFEVHAVMAVAQIIAGAFQSAYSGVVRAVGAIVSFVGGLPGRIVAAVGDLGSLLIHAGEQIINGLIHGIENKIGDLAGEAGHIASVIRSHLPFSPAKVGPLSGSGSPEIAGGKIATMLAAGIRNGRGQVADAMTALLGNGGTAGPSIIDNAIAGVPSAGAAARAAAAAAASSGSAAALAAGHLAAQTDLLERLLTATERIPAGVGQQLQQPSNNATLRSRGRVAGASR